MFLPGRDLAFKSIFKMSDYNIIGRCNKTNAIYTTEIQYENPWVKSSTQPIVYVYGDHSICLGASRNICKLKTPLTSDL